MLTHTAHGLGCGLPRELEWEKASRGTGRGGHTPGAIMITKASVTAKCVIEERPRRYRYGNMHRAVVLGAITRWRGNVFEWCEDLYEDKAYDRYKRGDFSASLGGYGRHVLRGGSYLAGFAQCSCENRVYATWPPPLHRQDTIGFRVASTLVS